MTGGVRQRPHIVQSVLLSPIVALTVDNIKDTVVKGMYTIDEVCPPKLQSACEKAGITG